MNPERAVNGILDREAWARERLVPHAERIVRLDCGPSAWTFRITQEGRIEASDAPVDASLRISPFDLPALLAHPERFAELVQSRGDPALSATLAELATSLPMIVEDGFARALGPFAGGAMARLGRHALDAPGFLAAKASQSVARYALEEAFPSIKGATLRGFAADVAALAARIDALDTRLDAGG